MRDEDQEQGILFDLEGPDEDSCVWIALKNVSGTSVFNLGPRDAVAEKFAQWLAQINFGS